MTHRAVRLRHVRNVGIYVNESNSRELVASLDDQTLVRIADDLCQVILDDGRVGLVGAGREVHEAPRTNVFLHSSPHRSPSMMAALMASSALFAPVLSAPWSRTLR